MQQDHDHKYPANLSEIALKPAEQELFLINGNPPSPFQVIIFRHILDNYKSCAISAVAGSGKSTLLVKIVEMLAQLKRFQFGKGIIVAFNNHIAVALEPKLKGLGASASTIHSLGYHALKAHLGAPPYVDKRKPKYKLLAEEWVNQQIPGRYKGKTWPTPAETKELVQELRNLVDFTRSTLTNYRSRSALADLATRFDITTTEWLFEGVYPILIKGESIAKDPSTKHATDFLDFLWLSYIWNVPLPKFSLLMVDEAQDLTPIQREFVLRLRDEHQCLMVIVGDENQAIQGWAGGDSTSINKLKEQTHATPLPLSITYRCPRSHVVLAQKLVPAIQAAPNAIEGQILSIYEDQLSEYVTSGAMILSRRTAPLVTYAFQLIKAKVNAKVRGQENFDEVLTTLAQKIGELPGYTYDQFELYLAQYVDKVSQQLLQKTPPRTSQIEALKEKAETLIAFKHSSPATTIDGLCTEIENLFKDQKSAVVLSTIHRAKGLEANDVFLLDADKFPYTWQGQAHWQWIEENCVYYVGLTRSRDRLFLVTKRNKSAKPDTIRFGKTRKH